MSPAPSDSPSRGFVPSRASNAREAPDAAFFARVTQPILRAVCAYHRFQVRGAEHVPEEGRALLVLTHSMITYESLLLQSRLADMRGRLMRGLADHIWFRVPGVSSPFERSGIIDGNPDVGLELLERDELVGVTPGGMWEALRPSNERHQVRWGKRLGFARLAIQTGAPVVLGCCPGADHVYTLYENPITERVYRRFKFPLPLMRGVGPTWFPRPAALTFHLAPPVLPPPRACATDDAEVARFAATLRERMESLIAEALAVEKLA
jgi:1-acyl-sn-glycerol-3-phosphate acyltransferase